MVAKTAHRAVVAVFAFLLPTTYLWMLPELGRRKFAARDHDCYVSQYIDNAQATGALWASLIPYVLLVSSIVHRMGSTVTSVAYALQLASWCVFTIATVSYIRWLHGLSVLLWVALALVSLLLTAKWTRDRTGAVPRLFVAHTVAFGLSSTLLCKKWCHQSIVATVYLAAVPLWYVRYGGLLPP